MNDQAGRHVVVACDEASIKVLAMIGKSASYSTLFLLFYAFFLLKTGSHPFTERLFDFAFESVNFALVQLLAVVQREVFEPAIFRTGTQ